MSEDLNEGVIRFSVKELLARVDLKIDGLSEKIDHRFDDHENRLRALETSTLTDDALQAAKKSFGVAVYRAVGAGVALLGVAVAAANYWT